MNEHWEIDALCEPERYELLAGPAYHFDLGRRDFCKVLGSGLVVLCLLGSTRGQQAGMGLRPSLPDLAVRAEGGPPFGSDPLGCFHHERSGWARRADGFITIPSVPLDPGAAASRTGTASDER